MLQSQTAFMVSLTLPPDTNSKHSSVPFSGNYKVQLYDFNVKDYLPSAPGIGMLVQIKDPDSKIILERVSVFIRHSTVYIPTGCGKGKKKGSYIWLFVGKWHCFACGF